MSLVTTKANFQSDEIFFCHTSDLITIAVTSIALAALSGFLYWQSVIDASIMGAIVGASGTLALATTTMLIIQLCTRRKEKNTATIDPNREKILREARVFTSLSQEKKREIRQEKHSQINRPNIKLPLPRLIFLEKETGETADDAISVKKAGINVKNGSVINYEWAEGQSVEIVIRHKAEEDYTPITIDKTMTAETTIQHCIDQHGLFGVAYKHGTKITDGKKILPDATKIIIYTFPKPS